jgi:hypothetical protein
VIGIGKAERACQFDWLCLMRLAMEDNEGVVEPEQKCVSAFSPGKRSRASQKSWSNILNLQYSLDLKPLRILLFAAAQLSQLQHDGVISALGTFFLTSGICYDDRVPIRDALARIMSSLSEKDRQEKNKFLSREKKTVPETKCRIRSEASMVSVPPVREFIVAYSAFSQQVVLPAHVTSKQDRRDQ